MNLLKFISGDIGTGVKEVADGLGGLAKDLRTAITGVDVEAQSKLKEIITKAETLQNQAQTEINKIEASHRSIFVAGWRPFIGWVCGFSLAYSFLIHPFLSWVCAIWYSDITPPEIATTVLFNLTMSMLGMGGLRTYEKFKGVTKNH
jgi:hypothetical protein